MHFQHAEPVYDGLTRKDIDFANRILDDLEITVRGARRNNSAQRINVSVHNYDDSKHIDLEPEEGEFLAYSDLEHVDPNLYHMGTDDFGVLRLSSKDTSPCRSISLHTRVETQGRERLKVYSEPTLRARPLLGGKK